MLDSSYPARYNGRVRHKEVYSCRRYIVIIKYADSMFTISSTEEEPGEEALFAWILSYNRNQQADETDGRIHKNG